MKMKVGQFPTMDPNSALSVSKDDTVFTQMKQVSPYYMSGVSK